MTDVEPTVPVRRAHLDDLAPRTLYEILALRSDVFVLEQECLYLDLDGRDLGTETEQFWIEDDDGLVVATARLLREDDTSWSIGRIVTALRARSRGLAAVLVRAAIERARERGAAAVLLASQSHLQDYYRRFGFETVGDEYVEDGIPHVPMRLNLGP